MIITNAINLNSGVGVTATNVYMSIAPNVETLGINGKSICYLKFYKSEADEVAGAGRLFPIVGSDFQNIISSCTIEFEQGEVVKTTANCTIENVMAYFKTKVSAKLLEEYGWVITL